MENKKTGHGVSIRRREIIKIFSSFLAHFHGHSAPSPKEGGRRDPPLDDGEIMTSFVRPAGDSPQKEQKKKWKTDKKNKRRRTSLPNIDRVSVNWSVRPINIKMAHPL